MQDVNPNRTNRSEQISFLPQPGHQDTESGQATTNEVGYMNAE
jgi:hypothetical protein